MVDVQPPDLETRIAIIQNKAVQLGFVLDDGIASYIASKITANVRQLEGTVKKSRPSGIWRAARSTSRLWTGPFRI